MPNDGDEMVQSNEPLSVRFVYTRAPECRTIHVSGARGGMTAGGEFRMDLFVEGALMADVTEVSLEGDGLGEELPVEPAGEPGVVLIERETQVRLAMSPKQAVSLAQWIMKLHDEWSQRLAKEGEETA